MNLLRTTTFLTCVTSLCIAAPFIAFSTHDHFSCAGQLSTSGICDQPHTSTVSQASIPALLHHLKHPSASQSDALPVHTSTSLPAPELILVVYARTLRSQSPQQLLGRIADAVSSAAKSADTRSASSFYATVDRDALKHDIAAVSERPLASLRDLAVQESAFDNGVTDIFTLSVDDEDEAGFVDTLRTISTRTKQRFALLFTTRETDADAAPAAENADAAPVPENADAAPAADSNVLEKTTSMNAPEISDAIVAGLLVLLIFLIIFIPGFMCLWNIQPPQSFETIDSIDAKKKMQ